VHENNVSGMTLKPMNQNIHIKKRHLFTMTVTNVLICKWL